MVSTADSKSVFAFEAVGLGSSPNGATNLSNMDAIIQSLKEHSEKALEYIQMVDREVRAKRLQNEQWFINWQDKLNEISVK